MTKKKLDELNEEIKKAKCESCEHEHENHEEHDGCACDCGCEDMYLPYDLEEIHSNYSFANIFSIVSKVVAIIYFIFGSYYAFGDLKYAIVSYEQAGQKLGFDFYIDFSLNFLSSIVLITFLFVAIGEVTNLLNRIKESLY